MMLPNSFVRSSFGLSARRSKMAVLDYAKHLCDDLRRAADVNFAVLPPGVAGTCRCEFDATDSVSGYLVRLDGTEMDGVHDRHSLDKAFVAAIVAAGHEAEHAAQFDFGDPEMALCHVAAAGNEDNYSENYIYNRREIAAEYAGLSSARYYLSERYPDMNTDGMLLDYIHGRIHDGRYWISDKGHDGFRSMDGVFAAFESAYEKAGSHVNKYCSRIRPGSKDAFAVLTGAGSGRGFDGRWLFLFDALSVSKDAHDSNMILASAALHVYPYLIREAAGAELPDLSIQAVFGCDPPDKPVEKTPAPGSAMSKLMRAIEKEDTEHGPDVPEYGP